jgi:hypothetical protein
LQQQQAALQGQVAMSTISLVLTAETDEPATTEPADDGSGFLAGLQGGWAAMLGFLVWFGGVAGALLPFLPLLVALALALWWVARRLRRRVGRGGPADPGSSPGGGEPVGAAGSGEPAAQTVGVGSS